MSRRGDRGGRARGTCSFQQPHALLVELDEPHRVRWRTCCRGEFGRRDRRSYPVRIRRCTPPRPRATGDAPQRAGGQPTRPQVQGVRRPVGDPRERARTSPAPRQPCSGSCRLREHRRGGGICRGDSRPCGRPQSHRSIAAAGGSSAGSAADGGCEGGDTTSGASGQAGCEMNPGETTVWSAKPGGGVLWSAWQHDLEPHRPAGWTTSSTILPRVRLVSPSSCAAAACSSGNVAATSTSTWPAVIRFPIVVSAVASGSTR